MKQNYFQLKLNLIPWLPRDDFDFEMLLLQQFTEMWHNENFHLSIPSFFICREMKKKKKLYIYNNYTRDNTPGAEQSKMYTAEKLKFIRARVSRVCLVYISVYNRSQRGCDVVCSCRRTEATHQLLKEKKNCFGYFWAFFHLKPTTRERRENNSRLYITWQKN